MQVLHWQALPMGRSASFSLFNAFQLAFFKGLVSYVLLEGDPPEDLIKLQEQPMEGEPLKKDITLNSHEGACKDFVDACLRYKPEDRPHINDLVNHPFLQISDVVEAKTRFSELVIDTLSQMNPPPEYSKRTYFDTV